VESAFLTKLMEYEAVRSYAARHASRTLEHFEWVVNTFVMDEAVEQTEQEDGRAPPKRQDTSNGQKPIVMQRRTPARMANSGDELEPGCGCSIFGQLPHLQAT